MEDPGRDINRVTDGIHNRGGPQLIQSSINTFNYHTYSVNATPPPRTLPRNSSRLFTGREDIATKLAQAFPQGLEPQSRSQRIFVISGLGGTGKSEVCLKFAEDHAASYWGVFWVDCSNESQANEGFKRIAYICRLPTSDMHAVKDFLSSSSEKWLLILDNADDPVIDYSQYLPANNKGDIIITTRNETSREEYSTVGSIQLDQLEAGLAQQLLLRALNVSQALSKDEAKSASMIIKELDRHTLAVLQAASFIKQNCPIEEYLDLYHQQKSRLFTFSRGHEVSTYKTVHATFEVSITHLNSIGQKGAKDAKDALNLLNVLSFMHFDGEFEQIFSSSTSRAFEILQQDTCSRESNRLELSEQHVKQLPNYFPKQGGSGSKLDWRQACNQLKMFSLIKVHGDDNDETRRISLHPLLHTWVRERQGSSLQAQSWYTALLTLALACPEDNNDYSYKYETLRSHIRICLTNRKVEHLQNHQASTIPAVLMEILFAQYHLREDYETDKLLSSIELELGDMSHNLRYSVTRFLSEDVSKRQFQINGKRKRDEDSMAGPESLQIVDLHAAYLRRRGDIFSALARRQYIAEVQGERLRHNEREFLFSQRRLADCYLGVGQKEKALEILELHLPAAQALKVSDLCRITYLESLANVYSKSCRTEKAVSILKEIVELKEENLDEKHTSRLWYQLLLAVAYQKNGQLPDAIGLIEEVARVQKTTLSTTHWLVKETQYSLADAYRKHGRMKDGIQILESIVETSSKSTTATKRTLSCDLQDLAGFLFKDYQDARALETMQRVISLNTECGLDIWHPENLDARRIIAFIHRQEGRNAEAIQVLEDVIEEREFFDPSNKVLIEVCKRLAQDYEKAGRSDEAKNLTLRISLSEHDSKN